MSQTSNNGKDEDRLRPPFPSRRDLHNSRIPQRPQGAPTPKESEDDAPAYSPQRPTFQGFTTPEEPRRQSDSGETVKESRSSSSQMPASLQQSASLRPPAKPQKPEGSKDSQPVPQSRPSAKETPGSGKLSWSALTAADTAATAPENESSDSQPTPRFQPQPTPQVGGESAQHEESADPEDDAPYSGGDTTGLRSRRLEQERLAYKKQKKRKKRWVTTVVLLIVLAVIAAGAWFAVSAIRGTGFSFGSLSAPADYPGPGEGEVEVTIEPGDLGTNIAQRLVDADVIKSTGAFIRAFDANPAAASIKPGTYTLKKHMVAADALAALLDEKNRSENTVTVVPGQTVSQVEEKLEGIADFSKEEIDKAIGDPAALGLPAEAGGKLEGWLWAGSYEVSSSDTPASVLSQMISRTVDFLKAQGIAPDQWETTLIKASILEREVASNEYMGKVARVIDNRLDHPEGETRGMLQMDSTVLYGVGKYGGVPTQADMENDNPYNTYRHAGLPPTPIATPGEAAIIATLNPEDGDWLYFVTVNLDTGETLFTNSAEEQTANTEKLIQWCSENPGKC